MKKNVAFAGLIVSIVVILILGIENLFTPSLIYILIWDVNQAPGFVIFLAAIIGFMGGVFWNMYRNAQQAELDEDASEDSDVSGGDEESTSGMEEQSTEGDVGGDENDDDDDDDVMTPGEEEEKKDSFNET
jgi:hypothetical protein